MANVDQVKKAVAVRSVRPMSPAVAEVRTNINLMVEVMKSCMVDGMHFGRIPGVDKPSLFKAGAEKIMATFRLSADPHVEDLSQGGEIRFRVKVEIKAKDGSFVGAGIGECSSGEEKYSWRKAVCQKEWDVTPETARRIKFKASYGKVDEILQVRVNPSDVANTILKMAKKRALVDAVLTATGASDLFSQDIEDLPEEYIASVAKEVAPATQQAPEEKKEEAVKTDAPEIKESPDKPVSWLMTHKKGDSILEWRGLVVGINTRSFPGKDGKQKTITGYICEDTHGERVMVERWGDAHEGADGSICTFFEIKVGEFKGDLQFLASRVVTDAEGRAS